MIVATLIGGDEDDLRVRRVDPDRVVVVAAGRAFDRRERLSAVGRAIRGRVGRVDDVGIGRIDADVGEVVAASPDARFGVHPRPARARIVRSVEAGCARGRPRVDPFPVTRRDADPDAAHAVGVRRQAAGERLPRAAAVDGLEQTARGSAVGVAVFPRSLTRGPEHGIHGLRVRRVEGEVDRAGVLVFVEHSLPRPSAVARAIDAAFVVRAVRMSERRREDAIGILRIDQQRTDLPGLAEAQVFPCLACVGGFVDAVADREVRPLQPSPLAT